jgi:hypothetical protein
LTLNLPKTAFEIYMICIDTNLKIEHAWCVSHTGENDMWTNRRSSSSTRTEHLRKFLSSLAGVTGISILATAALYSTTALDSQTQPVVNFNVLVSTRHLQWRAADWRTSPGQQGIRLWSHDSGWRRVRRVFLDLVAAFSTSGPWQVYHAA